MAETAVGRCPVDGGDIESKIVGSRLIKICLRCGIEERFDSVEDPESKELAMMDRLANEMEVGIVDDAKAGEIAIFTEPRHQIEHKGSAPQAEQDWKEIAKARLDVLLAQIIAAENASVEALEIHTALTSCGVKLPLLPKGLKK